MDFRDYIKTSIQTDKALLKKYRIDAGKYPNIRLQCRKKKTGFIEYYSVNTITGKRNYLGLKDCKKIVALQKKGFAQRFVKILVNNIKCKERLYKSLLSDNILDVIDSLPLAYKPNARIDDVFAKQALGSDQNKKVFQSQNPYKREQLTVITSFGLIVRSRGEMAIAEILHEMGIEFYYEKALKLRIEVVENGITYWVNKTYYPDFTIVLRDGTYIYWEHEGLLHKKDYSESNYIKLTHYCENRIFAGHNLIITGEGADNNIDMEGIRRIVDGWLMPLIQM